MSHLHKHLLNANLHMVVCKDLAPGSETDMGHALQEWQPWEL